MAKLSKRTTALRAKVDRNKAYPVAEAIALVKECATAKFDESVDVAVNPCRPRASCLPLLLSWPYSCGSPTKAWSGFFTT